MITISLCMIVKNEEQILKRCLDSVADLMDEIIIVDTGSTDRTKEIAARYTELIYDYQWSGNFADARNFSFSKATKDYIYCADADEIIDDENRAKFGLLKKGILPEIDIVQMYYCNQMQYNTIYNYDREYRPKLFKRLRTFTWINPIHETVRLSPVVYDSDIEIQHKPTGFHASRDLQAFEKMFKDKIPLSDKLHTLYAKELLIAGEKEDFVNAIPYFEDSLQNPAQSPEGQMEAYCVLTRAYRLKGEPTRFFKYTTKAVTSEGEGCSEICRELGLYYDSIGDYKEAIIWFYAAAESTAPILDLKAQQESYKHLADCYKKIDSPEQSVFFYEKYQETLSDIK